MSANHTITLSEACSQIQQGAIIAVPTEAVYGLSCDPLCEAALVRLLALKQRPPEKGLILVASHREQLDPFVDWPSLSPAQYEQLSSPATPPVTWVVPAKPSVSRRLRGSFDTIAVRLTEHPVLKALCALCQQALVSTSANISQAAPAKTIAEVTQQLGDDFPILAGALGTLKTPTAIIDLRTAKKWR